MVEDAMTRHGGTRKDLRKLLDDMDAPGPCRLAEGSAFEPVCRTSYDPQDSGDTSGMFTLHELDLRAGDTMNVTYDFGDNRRFSILIEKVEVSDTSIPETALSKYSNDQLTRARLVGKGDCRMMPQYDLEEEYDEDDDESDGESYDSMYP